MTSIQILTASPGQSLRQGADTESEKQNPTIEFRTVLADLSGKATSSSELPLKGVNADPTRFASSEKEDRENAPNSDLENTPFLAFKTEINSNESIPSSNLDESRRSADPKRVDGEMPKVVEFEQITSTAPAESPIQIRPAHESIILTPKAISNSRITPPTKTHIDSPPVHVEHFTVAGETFGNRSPYDSRIDRKTLNTSDAITDESAKRLRTELEPAKSSTRVDTPVNYPDNVPKTSNPSPEEPTKKLELTREPTSDAIERRAIPKPPYSEVISEWANPEKPAVSDQTDRNGRSADGHLSSFEPLPRFTEQSIKTKTESYSFDPNSIHQQKKLDVHNQFAPEKEPLRTYSQQAIVASSRAVPTSDLNSSNTHLKASSTQAVAEPKSAPANVQSGPVVALSRPSNNLKEQPVRIAKPEVGHTAIQITETRLIGPPTPLRQPAQRPNFSVTDEGTTSLKPAISPAPEQVVEPTALRGTPATHSTQVEGDPESIDASSPPPRGKSTKTSTDQILDASNRQEQRAHTELPELENSPPRSERQASGQVVASVRMFEPYVRNQPVSAEIRQGYPIEAHPPALNQLRPLVTVMPGNLASGASEVPVQSAPQDAERTEINVIKSNPSPTKAEFTEFPAPLAPIAKTMSEISFATETPPHSTQVVAKVDHIQSKIKLTAIPTLPNGVIPQNEPDNARLSEAIVVPPVHRETRAEKSAQHELSTDRSISDRSPTAETKAHLQSLSSPMPVPPNFGAVSANQAPSETAERPIRTDPIDVDFTVNSQSNGVSSSEGTRAASQSSFAHHVSPQIVAMAPKARNGIVEISLRPEELGRVRMSMNMVDGTVQVSLTVERPETMELMRRHMDILAQDFRSAGFQDVTFDFDGRHQHSENPDASDTNDSVREAEESNTAPSEQYVSQTSNERIDIRL